MNFIWEPDWLEQAPEDEFRRDLVATLRQIRDRVNETWDRVGALEAKTMTPEESAALHLAWLEEEIKA